MCVCVWGGEREGGEREGEEREGGERERGQGERGRGDKGREGEGTRGGGGVVLCPDHTSHKENGLVNHVEFLGLEAH